MARQEKDPYPLATDWQALARLIANVYYQINGADASYPMTDTYFSHPLPQALHALVYSTITGTAHVGMPYLTLLRRTPKKLFTAESSESFWREFNVEPTHGDWCTYAIFGKSIVQGEIPYEVSFSRVFSLGVFPYFSERLSAQCDVNLIRRKQPKHILLPHTVVENGKKIVPTDALQSRCQARAKVLAYLVNDVVFATLFDNGFTETAKTLYKLLVRDYGMPAELFTQQYEIAPQVGRKRDLTGQKFGRLHVLCEAEKASGGAGHVQWDCLCDCGQHVPDVESSDLLSWRAFSCGKCYPKGINKATMAKARLKATQAYFGAQTSCKQRAEKYAETSATRGFFKSEESNLENFVAKKRRDLYDTLFLMHNKDVVAAVAGLPFERILKSNKKDITTEPLDLHRSGHERMLADTIMMPYAASTICWIPQSWNKRHQGDSVVTPYCDDLSQGKQAVADMALVPAYADSGDLL